MTDTPRDFVPYVPGPPITDEPTSWMPGAVPPQGLERQPSKPVRTALYVGLGSGLAVVLVAGAIGVGLYSRQNGTPSVAPGEAEATRATTAATSAVAAKTSGPATFAITGTITLTTGYSGTTTCAGKGGFQDLHGGAQVSVLDSAGAVVALSQLLPGTVGAGGCVFLFGVTGVPAGKGFYEVTVAHRGGVRYAEGDLATRTIDLSLGT